MGLHAEGRLAAGTSTGGTGQCHPGRVVTDEIEGVQSWPGLIAIEARGTIVQVRNTPFIATARRTVG